MQGGDAVDRWLQLPLAKPRALILHVTYNWTVCFMSLPADEAQPAPGCELAAAGRCTRVLLAAVVKGHAGRSCASVMC